MIYDHETGLGYDYPDPIPTTGRNHQRAYQRGFRTYLQRTADSRLLNARALTPYQRQGSTFAWQRGWDDAEKLVKEGKGVPQP